jgi:hypothetical protein
MESAAASVSIYGQASWERTALSDDGQGMTSTCICLGSQTGICHRHPPQPILRPSRALKRPLKRSKSCRDARKYHSQVSHAPQACWRASRLGSQRLSQPQFTAFSRNLDCPRHSSAATATDDATGDATHALRYPSIVVDLSLVTPTCRLSPEPPCLRGSEATQPAQRRQRAASSPLRRCCTATHRKLQLAHVAQECAQSRRSVAQEHPARLVGPKYPR